MAQSHNFHQGPSAARISILKRWVECKRFYNERQAAVAALPCVAQEYAVTLKRVLPRSHAFTAAILGGRAAIKTWFNIELPEVHKSRVDLVGETLDGALIHIDVQSTNHEAIGRRCTSATR